MITVNCGKQITERKDVFLQEVRNGGHSRAILTRMSFSSEALAESGSEHPHTCGFLRAKASISVTRLLLPCGRKDHDFLLINRREGGGAQTCLKETWCKRMWDGHAHFLNVVQCMCIGAYV